MSQSSIVAKKIEERKKTVLPFIVHRAPLQNHLAYEKKGHWTEKEKLKYVIFLSYFKEKFTSRDKKKRFCRIFKVMSDFIKTRTHNQCRSHHQKMEKQRFQVDSIIKNVVSKYHPRVYQELYERYLIEIENLNLEQHEDYKVRSVNQNDIKDSSESDGEVGKNHTVKEIKQRLRAKQQGKRGQEMKEGCRAKIQEEIPQVPIILQKSCLNKRELRMTEECSEDEEQYNVVAEDMRHKMEGGKELMWGKNKSLDFNAYNNFIGIPTKDPKNTQTTFTDYLQALQIKKIDSFNKATYHYNQMHIELANVADCEKERAALLERQNDRMTQENGINYGFSNFFWGFQEYRKAF